MPMDQSGKMRPSHQLARAADKAAVTHKPEGAMKPPGSSEEGGDHTELHDHGDGSYHSVIDGEHTEHPSLGHALMHIATHHEPDGTHMHMHSDGMGIHSHHVKDGGEVEGPHELESPEEAGSHAAEVMGDGAMPHGEPDGDEGGMGMAGMHAMMGMK